MLKNILTLALVGSTCLVPVKAFASQDRVSAVTLYSGGVARVTRSVEAGPGENLQITVSVDDVSDILKSLVIRPVGEGSVTRLSVSAAPGEENGADLLSPSTLSSLPALLDALRGTRVRIESGGPVEGVVLGVVELVEGEDRRSAHAVSILVSDGDVRSIALRPDARVEILDEDIAGRLARSAGSLSVALNDRQRTLTIDGSGNLSSVDLDYVVEAPVWKASHRLVLGEDGTARLQTWAVVENDTDERWDGVRLVLSSGSPVTLRQDLLTPHYAERSEVPVFVDRQAVASPDRGAVPEAMAFMAEPPMPAADMARGSVAVQKAFAPAAPMAEASAEEGNYAATYEVAGSVDLSPAHSLTLPLVDDTVAAEKLAVFDPNRGGEHPTATVRLRNSTGASLPAGVVTVYDQSGFLGDSTVLAVPTDAERNLQFALDRSIVIGQENDAESVISQVRIVDGVLEYRETDVQETRYAIRNDSDEGKTVAIEHPRIPGWTLVSSEGASLTAEAHRIERTVDAGGSVTAVARMERVRNETFALVEAASPRLIQFSELAADEETKRKLTELANVRGEASRLEEELQRLDARRIELVSDQERTRANLQSASQNNSRVAQEYLDRLQEQEARIAEIDERRTAVQSDLQEIGTVSREMIRTF